MEILSGKLFERIFVCRQHVDLFVHFTDLLMVSFDLVTLLSQFDAGAYPAYYIVLFEQFDSHDENYGSNACVSYKALMLAVPYVFK